MDTIRSIKLFVVLGGSLWFGFSLLDLLQAIKYEFYPAANSSLGVAFGLAIVFGTIAYTLFEDSFQLRDDTKRLRTRGYDIEQKLTMINEKLRKLE